MARARTRLAPQVKLPRVRLPGFTRSEERYLGVALILGAVMSVDQANRATIGAVGPQLERALNIGNTEIGLLAGAFSIAVAFGTIPVGVLTDRVRRVGLLGVGLVTWSVAMLVTGAAESFRTFFIAQAVLGILAAIALPVVMSLAGDFFPRKKRARMLGVVSSGELVGAGVGFVLAGVVAQAFGWRWSFWLLAIAGLGVLVLVRRMPEPTRGAMEEAEAPEDPCDSAESLKDALAYVFRVRTNVYVMAAGAVGIAFFAVLRTFAVIYLVRRYGIEPQNSAPLIPLVGIAAIAGLIGGGRFADYLMAHGVKAGRVWVAAVGYIVAAVALMGAVLTPSLWVAAPLCVIGTVALSAPNPALDAVRLDVILPRLRGRAESVRTIVRTAGEAIGPPLFGVLSDTIGGGGVRGLHASTVGLMPALLLSGALLLFAVRTYPADVDAVRHESMPQRRRDRRKALRERTAS